MKIFYFLFSKMTCIPTGDSDKIEPASETIEFVDIAKSTPDRVVMATVQVSAYSPESYADTNENCGVHPRCGLCGWFSQGTHVCHYCHRDFCKLCLEEREDALDPTFEFVIFVCRDCRVGNKN